MMFRHVLVAGMLFVSTGLVHAEQSTTQKAAVNFTDHVLPIFRQHCLVCHNANDAEGGLAIDSYGGLMEGGGGGDVVSPGDVSASRLYLVMTHAEEPTMPPDQDPLPKESLELIRKWIEGGLLENSGSKAKKRKGPSLTFASSDGGKPDEIIMPESVWRVPVVTSERAAAATALAASPWAPLVAVAGQRQVSLYNSDSGELLGIIPYPEGIPQVLQFSRDGGYLLVAGGAHSSQGTASLYDVRNGERLLKVGDELDIVFGADINDRLSRVAMGGPQKIVRIFDTATGESLFELKKHTDWVYCVDYSPDGVLVASGDRSGGLHVWEADTGRLYLDLVGHKGAIRGLSWRPDSNVLVSASEDGTVKMWEMSAGKQLRSFNAHGGGVTGVTMAKDGRLVTSGKDRTVKLWKADGGAVATMPAFGEPALEATVTHDGKKIIGGDWNGRTLMWLISDPKQVTELAANPPRLEDQASLLDSQIAGLGKSLADAKTELTNREQVQRNSRQQETALAAKVQETKTLLAQANSDKSAAEQLFGDLQKEKAEDAKRLQAMVQRVTELNQVSNQANAKLAAQRKALTDATSRQNSANKDKESVAQSLALSRAEHAKLKSSAVAMLASLTDRELEILAKEHVAAGDVANAAAACQKAESAVATLNTQLSALADSIKQADQISKSVNVTLNAVTQVIAATTAQRDKNKMQMEAKTAELATIQKQLSESQDEAEKNSLTEKVAAAELEIEAASKTQVELEKLLAGKVAEKTSQEKLIEESRQRIATASKQTKTMTAKRDQVSASLPPMIAERDRFAKERGVLAEQLNKLRSETESANHNKDEAVKKMAALVAKQSQMMQREQQLIAVVLQQETARATATSNVTTFEKSLSDTNGLLANAQAEIKTTEAKIADLANRIGAQPAVIQRLVDQIKSHTATIPNLEKQLAEAKKKTEESSAAMTNAKSALDSVTAQVNQTESRLEGVLLELAAFRAQSEKLQTELAAAQAVADAKRTAVLPESAVATKLGEAMSSRDTKLAEVAEALKKVQAQLDELQKQRSVEQAKLDESKTRLQKLEAAADEAESTAEATKEKLEFFQSAYGSRDES